jgi:ATP-dependent DNA helicase RecG
VTPEDLVQLVERGETYTVEFKRDVNDSELTTNVVCLANGDGGVLLIGVDDDGSVIGARPRHGLSTHPERLSALVTNTTSPPVNVTASTVEIDHKTVIIIEVPKQTSLVSTTSGFYIRRALDVNGHPQCLPMQPHDAIARLASVGQRDLSAMPVLDATDDDLDELEIGRFRETVRTIGDRALAELSTNDLVSALGFRTVDGDLVMGAILMFGTEQSLRRFVPTHEVAFQALDRSGGVQVNRIQRIPLVRAMTDLSGAIASFNPEEEVEYGLLRIGLPRFSDVAIRETIANALVHRNYGLVGQVRAAIENDVLSVTSPGAFPDGITVHNLLSVPPKPRNPLLADAFKRAGLVERTGRGVNRVFASQLELGRPAPDYSRSTGDWVEVRMRSGPADQDLAAFIASVRSRGDGSVDLRFLQVLHEVRQERRITSDRAAEVLQVSIDEARAELNKLVEQGLLEARGERKGRSYHLASSVYDELGEQVQYVRTRGFDSLQHEQMVLTYVEKYNTIRRSDVVRLCQLEPAQATRLLSRMVDSEKLELRGEKRGAHYVLPEPGRAD